MLLIYIDLDIFAKNFLTNNFYRYGLPIISPTKVFPYTAIPAIDIACEVLGTDDNSL